ncbi:unnamed protein product [Diamesa serratosioi]
MDRKFNEYEHREAKNFFLLDCGRDDGIHKSKRNTQFTKPARKVPLCEKAGPRVRSASTGRDKRSEFQARYWSFLFGNLQRAVDEIYKTVEYYENLASCQEAILVLENYVREFKALAEFFKMSWDYEKTLPNRPHSLAWEVRKTNVQPRVRNKNITSPASLSGKSSPSYSGNTTPCPTISENKLIMSPNKTKPPIRTKKLEAPTIEISDPAAELMALKEKQFEQLLKDSLPIEPEVLQKNKSMSLENLQETMDNCTNDFGFFNRTEKNTPEFVVIPKTDSSTITEGIHDDNLTLLEYLTKYSTSSVISPENHKDQKNQTIADTPSDVPSSIPPSLKIVLEEIKPKPIIKLPLKANYSLRNQTIRNSKAAPENLIKKSSSIALVSNRSKPANTIKSYANPSNQNNIPTTRATTSAVLINRNNHENINNQKYQHNLSVIRSKTMIEMPNKNIRRPILIKAGDLLKNSSKEDIDSSTSTLKGSTNSIIGGGVGGGDGFKRVNSKKSENKVCSGDGEWVTVKKTKRRSSWTSRFDQPSASASLPSLSLLNESPDSNSDESVKEKSVVKSPKSSGESSCSPKSSDKKLNVDEKKNLKPKAVTIVINQKMDGIQKQKTAVPTILKGGKSQKIIKQKMATNVTSTNARKLVPEKPKSVLTSSKQNCQDNILANGFLPKRQKSDLTGLKIKSLRKEYLRSEKINSMLPTKHQKPMTAAKNEKNFQDASNCANKVDMNVQTILISQTIDELYTELKESQEKYSKNEDLSSCEESDDTDEDQKTLLEEQESLERQIRELENTELDDIDLDTETDETDCEAMLCELEDGSENNDPAERNVFIDNSNPDLTLEMRYAPMLSELTSAERAETLATLQELVARDPGRAQKLHQKLSSPSRRRSFHETLKNYQAKQSRAQEKRFALRQKNAQKIQLLIQRVEQVKAAKSQLIENKRLRMEERLQRAAENREVFLKNKVRKAHDEEEKLKEIVFIKSLEAQNKRLELLESNKDTDMRLADIEQERQKRAEEKAAKEAAVERRRLELEMERKKKLEKMDETRREREQRVSAIQEDKEKKRQEIAKEKQRDRDKRLQQMQLKEIQDHEDLQRKIFQKQQESVIRREENIEHIKQRALELASQRPTDECKALIDEDEINEIAERSREAIKLGKKKMKKIRQKFAVLSQAYMSELPELSVAIKKQSQIPKLLNAISKRNSGTSGVQMGVERPIGQISRIVAKSQVADFKALWLLDGLGILANVIECGLQPYSDISRKALVMAIQLYREACSSCKQIANHAILGGSILVLFDALAFTLMNPDEEDNITNTCPVEMSTEILLPVTVSLSNIKQQEHPQLVQLLPDLVGYITASGILQQISRKCLRIREPIENQHSLLLPLMAMIGFLTKITEICPPDDGNYSTKFLSIVKSTEIFGTISLLYSTVVPNDTTIPRRTISLSATTFHLLKAIAILNVNCFQQLLEQQKLTFKFLDVVTILLNYCGPKLDDNKETKAVIIDVIAVLGYFCANNKNNQNLLTSEQSYIILKSITKLPNEFDPYVYPLMVAICWENQEAQNVLSKDFNIDLLWEFHKSDYAKKNKLLQSLEL